MKNAFYKLTLKTYKEKRQKEFLGSKRSPLISQNITLIFMM